MATIFKNSTETLAGTGWVGNAVPTTADIAYIGSDAGSLAFIPNLGTTYNASALQVATDFLGPTLNILSTSNTEIYRIYNQNSASQRVDGVYALYVAAGKNLGMAQRLQLRGPNSGQTTHRWYIGTGGSFILNPATNTGQYGDVEAGALGAGLAMRVVKEGPGYAYIARSTSAINTTGTLFPGGYTIRDGEIRLDGFSSANPLGTTVAGVTDSNTLIFDPDSVSAQPTLRFVVNQSSARTVPNPVTVNTRGTITVEGAFVATMTGAASGSGTLTIARTSTGGVTWNNNISCPLNVTGLLTMGASNNISGTLSGGSGTIAMSSGTISGDAQGFAGYVTGTFTYNATGGRTFGGNIQGTVTVSGGTLTATAANSGQIADIGGGAAVTLSGIGAFTGDSANYTILGTSPSAGQATLSLTGPNTSFTRNIGLRNGSRVRLSGGSTLTAAIIVANTDTTTTELTVEDATVNTFTGSYISNLASGSDNISAFIGGTLVLSGSVNGIDSRRTWNLNGTSNSYTGTIKVTGTGFTGAASAALKRGWLLMERASAIGLAGGLTVDSGATIACSTPNAAYAAQLSGALTLSAGSVMQFGAP